MEEDLCHLCLPWFSGFQYRYGSDRVSRSIEWAG